MNYIRRKFLAAGLAFIFFDRRRSLWICSGFALLSFFAEIKLSVPGLFSSSGAIFTIAGLFLNIKHTLHFHLKLPKKNIYNMLAGAGIFGSDMTKEGEAWVDNILSDEIFGVTFMVIGTLIWAYGSYLM